MRQLWAAVAMTAWGTSASASCNNPNNWLESPSSQEGLIVLVGYEQKLGDFATSALTDLKTSTFPPPLPADMLEQHGQGKLSATDRDVVSYYEPDQKGNWRLCRKEVWWPNENDPPSWVLAANKKNQSKNPIATALLKTHRMRVSEPYLYDNKGRVLEKFSAQFDEKGAWTGLRECFRYDYGDRAVLHVRATESNVCPIGDPDPRDTWVKRQFGETGSEVVRLRTEEHTGHKDGTWSKRINFKAGLRFDGAPIRAKVDSEKGVEEIIGDSKYLASKDQSQSDWIVFPSPPVPESTLSNFDEIYQYSRRRHSRDGPILMVEYFPPRVNVLRDRFYTGSGRTLRQEQFDAQGRLKRVINLGMIGLNKSNGGFYEEDISSGKISAKLKTHQLYYRVWEYNQTGESKLVAIGWNVKVGSKFGRDTLDAATLAYGTPDGKIRWKTKEEFFKAFDFDPTAQRAYPEIAGKR